MKIRKVFFIFPRVFFALAIGLFFFNYKSFVYADQDALVNLQKDVLAAKEKSSDFNDKVKNIDQALGDPKTSALQHEADNLITELTQKNTPAAATAKEIPVSAKSTTLLPKETYQFKFPSPRSFEPRPDLAPKKPWVFNPMPKIFGFGGNDYNKVSDGEALYKVAISDGKISIHEAIGIAIANSIQLQALKKKVEVANAKWTEAKRALLPTAQFVYEDNGGRNPATEGNRLYRGRNSKINMSQPLYYGGELVLTSKQAEENLKSSRLDYEKAKNELVQQVRTAYYGVVKTEYNYQYQMDVQKEVETIYKIVKSVHDQKLIAEVDYLNAQSQSLQANFSADSTHNDLLAAYLTLRQALNLDSSADLPIDLRLYFKKTHPDFPTLLDFAMNNNPEILSKELSFLSAQDGVEIYEAKKRPRFDLRGSFGHLGENYVDSLAQTDPTAEKIPQKREWYLGVHGSLALGANSVEIDDIKHQYGPTVSAFQGSEDWRHTVKFNLLDKLADVTDAISAQATLLQAQADWQKSRNDVIFKLKDNFYSLQKALLQMESAVSKMHYQEKQNAITKYNVSLQEAAPSSYLEGLIEQASNRFAFIQAVTDYNLALSNIGATCGDPFYFDKDEN